MTAKPLAGKIIVVTRPKNQALHFIKQFKTNGARVIAAPTIRIAAPSSYHDLDFALRHLPTYDALAFVSVNAVDSFFARARKLKMRGLKSPPSVFAVGPLTAAALFKRGWPVRKIPEQHNAQALAKIICKSYVKNWRILVPQAKEGRKDLIQALKKRGAKVQSVEAYQTKPDKRHAKLLRHMALAGTIDAVTFTSGSTVKSLAQQIGQAAWKKLFTHAAAASIGPVTSANLRALKVKSIIEAKEATTESLLQELKEYFKRRS